MNNIIIQEMESLPQMNDGQPLAWRAPRTGKVVRSIHTDPSVPYSQLQHCITPSPLPSPTHPRSSLSLKQLIAEALYIARPLVHCKICVFRARTHTHTHTLSLSLSHAHTHTHTYTHTVAAMFGFSQRSWKPWLLSLSMDLVSLQLHGGLLRWRSKEKSEIVRRRVSLLFYLLRAPFYDRFTKEVLVKILLFLSATLPLVKIVVDPLLQYIPVWQNTYCYNWSS